LIHLSSGCHTINCQEKDFLWPDFGEKMFDICENAKEYIFFGNPECRFIIPRMRAASVEKILPIVDDSVHI